MFIFVGFPDAVVAAGSDASRDVTVTTKTSMTNFASSLVLNLL